jgi:8-oxo-dGTP pyrophosphatase MutT (NUDIX family)
MRELIAHRLAVTQPQGDARTRMLADAEGPVSPALLELIDRPSRQAAVLLGLVERAAGWTVLFTERAQHLTHHPGQVSFPGGRVEANGDPVAAALREAWEEVRLAPEDVAVAGCLAPQITATGFSVTPVVGFVRGRFDPQPDPAEVAAVFEVPLDYILDGRNIRITYRERFGTRFRVHELSYGRHLIWGATATMLVSFRELITDE